MFRHFSLSAKLLLTYVPLFIVAIVGSYMLTTQASEEQMLDQAKVAAFQKAHIVRESLVNMMLDREMVDESYLEKIRNVGGLKDLYIRIVTDSLHLKDFLEDSVRTVRLNKRMQYAFAKGSTGNEVFATGIPLYVKREDDFEAVIPFKAEKKCQTCHDVPINAVLGVAHVQLPLSEIKTAIRENSYRTAMISFGFAVVALGIGFFFYRSLIRNPIKNLVAATEAIGQGNLTGDMKISESNDELGQLSRSFDRMRKALRQSQEALRSSTVGQIASSLIRDFRAPMREITNAVDQIQKAPVDDVQKVQLCENARNSVQVMTKMTQDLVDFTSGELKVNKRSCNIGQIINYAVSAMKQDLEKDEITIEVELGYSGNAPLDYDRTSRALINLISYSANYTPPGGVIKVSTAASGNNIVFKVADNGSGIPKAFLDKVFEPFVKIVQERGVGLGLALAKRIVDMQGGKIVVSSEEGKGTMFTITMPL
ncbi:MAG: HAMP domain-containing histidine kinase [Ignavibacteriales bacterium]|nr:HAMP domain-containing histidine kinase [Ignavibacteriales bacterium]